MRRGSRPHLSLLLFLLLPFHLSHEQEYYQHHEKQQHRRADHDPQPRIVVGTSREQNIIDVVNGFFIFSNTDVHPDACAHIVTVTVRNVKCNGVISGGKFPHELHFGTQGAVLGDVRRPEKRQVIAVRVHGSRCVEDYLAIYIMVFTVSGGKDHRHGLRIHPDAVRRRYIYPGTESVIGSPSYVIIAAPFEFDGHQNLCRVSRDDVGGRLPRPEIFITRSPVGDGILHRFRIHPRSVVQYRDETLYLELVGGSSLIRGDIPEIDRRRVDLYVELVGHRAGISHEIGAPEHDEIVLSLPVCESDRDLVIVVVDHDHVLRLDLHPAPEIPRTRCGYSGLQRIRVYAYPYVGNADLRGDGPLAEPVRGR